MSEYATVSSKVQQVMVIIMLTLQPMNLAPTQQLPNQKVVGTCRQANLLILLSLFDTF